MKSPRNPPKYSKRPEDIQDLLCYERDLFASGIELIGGVDEVGRGSVAGPVCAGAVVFPPHIFIPEVDDSKKLTPSIRERLFNEICKKAVCWAVAFLSAEEIDRINIHQASLKAMSLAVAQLKTPPQCLLVDGRFSIPDCDVPQKPVVRGDSLSHSIASASILAKVIRDRWMVEEGKKYPQFHFKKHKGYGTAEHREEIRKYGLTPLHRKSFTSFYS